MPCFFASSMIGVQRSKDSAIVQLVFFCENVSVAAAKSEISVVLAVLDGDGSGVDIAFGSAVDVEGARPAACSACIVGGGVAYEASGDVCDFLITDTRFCKPLTFGMR
jgi:hypothetical protein